MRNTNGLSYLRHSAQDRRVAPRLRFFGSPGGWPGLPFCWGAVGTSGEDIFGGDGGGYEERTRRVAASRKLERYLIRTHPSDDKRQMRSTLFGKFLPLIPVILMRPLPALSSAHRVSHFTLMSGQ